MKDFIISHMNDHHKDSLIKLVQKFAFVKNVDFVQMVGVDGAGMDIKYNDSQNLRIDFPAKVSDEQIKDEIIALCKRVGDSQNQGTDSQVSQVEQEILEFRQGFGSVILASLDSENQVISSYAALIHYQGNCYIYISSVADHYHSIKANPNNVEALFLEDECKAKSVILRKRLRYKVNATFIDRNSDEFENAFAVLENSMGGAGGVKQIKTFTDFDLVRLDFGKGRFVKGFGQAYDIDENGKVSYVGASGNPHSKNPHSK